MITTYTVLPFLAPFVFGNQSQTPLKWDVFLQPPLPAVNSPNNDPWPPTTFTLIHGHRTAILIDAPITVASSNALADWIEATIPGKRLAFNYITHGHGDHFFGSAVLKQRFPGLKIVATEQTVAHIQEQLLPEQLSNFWDPLFPGGQIPVQNQSFEVLPKNHQFWLDGRVVRVLEVGHSDTYNTTIFHIPSLEMVVTGDVVYGSCFLYMVESYTPDLRREWIKAIDQVEKLKPKIIVPSHRQEGDGFGVEHLTKTKDYLRAWGSLVEEAKSVDDLIAKVKDMFGDRIGDFILQISAQAAFQSV